MNMFNSNKIIKQNNNEESSTTTWPLIENSTDPAPPYQPLLSSSNQQATLTTFPSRLKLGTSSLAQPIYTNTYIQHRLQRPNSPIESNSTNNLSNIPSSEPGKRTRRVVNYSENDASRAAFLDPDLDPSLDEEPRPPRPPGVRGRPSLSSRLTANLNHQHNASIGNQSSNLLLKLNPRHSTPNSLINSEQEARKNLLDDLNKRKFGDGRSYLGLDPPAKFIKVEKKSHLSSLLSNALSSSEKNDHPNDQVCLIPIRIELDTDKLRIRDVLTWNLQERYITPEIFAMEFCSDSGIQSDIYAPKIIEQIKSQLKQYAFVSSTKLIPDEAELSRFSEDQLVGIEPDLRVIIQLDVQIETIHLIDRIEWDLASILTPELFTAQYICDLNLPRSASPIIAHAIHEEICRHKQDCLSLGLISQEILLSTKLNQTKDLDGNHNNSINLANNNNHNNNSIGIIQTSFKIETDPLLKEKYGNSRGPKKLEGVWRDWHEANLFGPKLQFIHVEDLEWMEIEKDRLARRSRRETTRTVRRR